MSFFGSRYYNPRPLARFSFQSMMAGPAGIFQHFLAIKSIKKVPKERGTRSNAGLGASGYTLFSLSFDRSSDFVLSCGYILFTILMIWFSCDLSVDRRLDVSFVLDGLVGKIWVMMDWELWIYRAGRLLADFPVEHACVLTDDGDFR